MCGENVSNNNVVQSQQQNQSQNIWRNTSGGDISQRQQYSSPNCLQQSYYQNRVPFQQVQHMQQLDLDIDSDSGEYAEIRAKSTDQNEFNKFDKKRESNTSENFF